MREQVGLAIIVAAALVFVVLERILPDRPAQRLFRKGFWVDLVAYGIVQSCLLGVVIELALWDWIFGTAYLRMSNALQLRTPDRNNGPG